MEYLYDKLKKYAGSSYYGFHMPGHKRNCCITGANLPYFLDITEIDGFDDLHHANGILRDGEKRAAHLYHAEETHYLINGSTAGILSAVLGCTQRGDDILMSRNCHKSVYNAVIMNELHPIYIYPDLAADMQLAGSVNPGKIKNILMQYPNIKAVIITSPTYDGAVSDVRAISKIVHRKNIPLILDEAHGAHFGFDPYFPDNGNVCGADVVIHSLHKTLPSLTQTALIHLNGKIADREKIRWYLHALQTSSPSYVLMASIDECIRLLERKKDSLFSEYVLRLKRCRKQMKELKYLHILETDMYDNSKILLSARGTGKRNQDKTIKFTGKELYNILLEKYLLQMEMATDSYIVAMTSLADTEEGIDRLLNAVREIDQNLAEFQWDEGENSALQIEGNVQIYTPAEAGKVDERLSVSFSECTGRTALEYAYLYPPGIPLIVPGEKISSAAVKKLTEYERAGFKIEGTKKDGQIEVKKNG